MKITEVSQTPEVQVPHAATVKKLYDLTEAQVMHIQLEPGKQLYPHITPVDVFFYVLEGTPTIEVGKEQQQVTRDMLVESPRDIPHCIYNNSDAPCRVLVVKTPKPEKKSTLL